MKTRNDLGWTTAQEVADWYNAKYTEMGDGWLTPTDACLEQLAAMGYSIDSAFVGPETKLIDVGCGAGHLVAAAATVGGIVDGIDLSSVGIEYARARCPEDGSTMLVVAELHDWAMRNTGQYDFLISLGSIEHALEVPGAIKDCYWLLKPGGRFNIYAPTLDWVYTDQPLESLCDPEEWAQLCRDAGLVVTTVEVMNDNCRIVGYRP